MAADKQPQPTPQPTLRQDQQPKPRPTRGPISRLRSIGTGGR